MGAGVMRADRGEGVEGVHEVAERAELDDEDALGGTLSGTWHQRCRMRAVRGGSGGLRSGFDDIQHML